MLVDFPCVLSTFHLNASSLLSMMENQWSLRCANKLHSLHSGSRFAVLAPSPSPPPLSTNACLLCLLSWLSIAKPVNALAADLASLYQNHRKVPAPQTIYSTQLPLDSISLCLHFRTTHFDMGTTLLQFAVSLVHVKFPLIKHEHAPTPSNAISNGLTTLSASQFAHTTLYNSRW